jgi:DnaK suppressor protein
MNQVPFEEIMASAPDVIEDDVEGRADSDLRNMLHGQLMDTRARLQAELQRENSFQAASDRYGALAGDVGDTGDASVATEQAELRHAQISRDLGELRQVEAALSRWEEGSYGICSNCGLDISQARLRANAAAERCIVCQTAFERQYADAGSPSITRKV